jgi:hypothetical protein
MTKNGNLAIFQLQAIEIQIFKQLINEMPFMGLRGNVY